MDDGNCSFISHIFVILIFVFALRTFSAQAIVCCDWNRARLYAMVMAQQAGVGRQPTPTVVAPDTIHVYCYYFPCAMRQTFNFTFTYEYTMFKASARAHCVPTAAHKILHLMKMLPAAAATA